MSNARNLANLLGTDTKVQTADIADAAFQANKNLIINGAMQVAQRGTSATVTTGSGPQTCDRFFVEAASSGTFSITQSTVSPDGFANSLKFDCTVADASPNFLLFGYRIEGQDAQNLKKGTSGAVSTTLSFYVRSSKTGTYQVNLRDIDNGRIIGATYTISSADTWEYKTVTFAGDTSGTLDNDNGNSLTVEWWLASGSTYNSGAVPTAWEAKLDGDRAAGLNVAIGASTSDDFYITGVQLEVGETATPFEHRSYGDELAKCQRYYFEPDNNANNRYAYWRGDITNGNTYSIGVEFPVSMRALPTITVLDGLRAGFDSGVTANAETNSSCRLNGSANVTQAARYFFQAVQADAEL